MEDLNSFKDRLEANLSLLNRFEGLESDLVQQHGNLRAQFSEYFEAIEKATGITEQERREHFAFHDELIKRLHKLILVAKGLARKRTEQMTREELFKISQERQKSLKPQSAEDKIGEEVTKSLKRMLETMRTEIERSSSNISTATSTSKNLHGTTENYQKLSGTLDESRNLIRDLWRKNRNDMIYIFAALGVFLATVAYVLHQRTPGIIWLPGKLLLNQLVNLIPKSNEIVDKLTEITEAVLSDNEVNIEPPKMFIDTIPILEQEDGDVQVEFGSDELLKDDYDGDGDGDTKMESHHVAHESIEATDHSGAKKDEFKESQMNESTSEVTPESTSEVAVINDSSNEVDTIPTDSDKLPDPEVSVITESEKRLDDIKPIDLTTSTAPESEIDINNETEPKNPTIAEEIVTPIVEQLSTSNTVDPTDSNTLNVMTETISNHVITESEPSVSVIESEPSSSIVSPTSSSDYEASSQDSEGEISSREGEISSPDYSSETDLFKENELKPEL